MPEDFTTKKNEHIHYNKKKRKINLQYFVAADVACAVLGTLFLTSDPPGCPSVQELLGVI